MASSVLNVKVQFGLGLNADSRQPTRSQKRIVLTEKAPNAASEGGKHAQHGEKILHVSQRKEGGVMTLSKEQKQDNKSQMNQICEFMLFTKLTEQSDK